MRFVFLTAKAVCFTLSLFLQPKSQWHQVKSRTGNKASGAGKSKVIIDTCKNINININWPHTKEELFNSRLSRFTGINKSAFPFDIMHLCSTIKHQNSFSEITTGVCSRYICNNIKSCKNIIVVMKSVVVVKSHASWDR